MEGNRTSPRWAARAAAAVVGAWPFAGREDSTAGGREEEAAARVPVLEMSCHGSDERLVFKHELIPSFYKNTCVSTLVLTHVSKRILRRMGYICAFSVIF